MSKSSLNEPAGAQSSRSGGRLPRGRGFWLVNLAGWLAYGVAVFLTFLPAVAPEQRLSLLLFKAVIRPVAGFAASVALVAIFRARADAFPTRTTPWVMLAASGVLGGALWFMLTQLILRGAGLAEGGLTLRSVLHGSAEYVFVMLAWTATFWLSALWRHSLRQETAAAQARALAHETQLRMLGAQMSPHYLFNSLASLRNLVRTDAVAAEEMIGHMAGFLRRTLHAPYTPWCTVEQELSLVDSYVQLERRRLGAALSVTTDVEPSLASSSMPAFALFPLVENAVKHGAPAADGVLRVEIRARRDGARAHFTVINSGTMCDVGGDGTGLRNLRERLQHLLPGEHTLRLEPMDGRVIAALSVPVRP